jgi:hypothetical protein
MVSHRVGSIGRISGTDSQLLSLIRVTARLAALIGDEAAGYRLPTAERSTGHEAASSLQTFHPTSRSPLGFRSSNASTRPARPSRPRARRVAQESEESRDRNGRLGQLTGIAAAKKVGRSLLDRRRRHAAEHVPKFNLNKTSEE